MDGSLGYIDAKYVGFSAAARANFAGIDSFKLPNTPKWTYNIGGSVTFFDNDMGNASARVDWSHRSGQFKEFSNNPYVYQEGYGILNASLTYRDAAKRWSASVGATNLTDKAYIVSGVVGGGSGYAQGAVGRPREWYLRVGYDF